MIKLYPNAFQQLLDGDIDWEDVDIRALFLSSAFQYDPAHVNVIDVPDNVVIARSELLEDATFDDELASGSPIEFPLFVDQRQINSVVVFYDTGDDDYSPLLLFADADHVEGLPLLPAGLQLFLYPIFPFGGFFQILRELLIGPINTYAIGGPYALNESDGGDAYLTDRLFVGGRLQVRARVCARPIEEDSCCKPTIRSSSCE